MHVGALGGLAKDDEAAATGVLHSAWSLLSAWPRDGMQ